MMKTIRDEFNNSIKARDEKIVSLENELSAVKERLGRLEERTEDNESYERRDSLIFSGPKLPPYSGNENCVQIVRNLAREHLKISIPENEISVAHHLGSRNAAGSQNKRSIIAKFCRRNTKTDLLASARQMKIENLYVNECLTPQQRTIGFVLRKLKKDYPARISGSTTIDGKHYVWMKSQNSSTQNARNTKIPIGTIEKLRGFCLNQFQKPLGEYIDESRLI